jgi:hypothetical protein
MQLKPKWNRTIAGNGAISNRKWYNACDSSPVFIWIMAPSLLHLPLIAVATGNE